MTYEERKKYNTSIINDTISFIKGNRYLSAKVEDSVSALSYFENGCGLVKSDRRFEEKAEVVVTKNRTAEALYNYKKESVVLLNFASARNPGGGVMKGSNAQEESLCRVSTLYPVLTSEKAKPYYRRHRDDCSSTSFYYSDSVLISKGIVFFRNDDSFMDKRNEKDWKEATVITAAAPNLRNVGYFNQAAFIKTAESRIESVFKASSMSGADILILGAFGCGAFRNPPEIVSQIFKEIQQDYMHSFKRIEYALAARDDEDLNYSVFRSIAF